MINNLKDINRENLLGFCLSNDFRTLQDMGDYFGVTRERVRQVLSDKGAINPFTHINNYRKYKDCTSNHKVTVDNEVWMPVFQDCKVNLEVSDKGNVRQVKTKKFGVFHHTYTVPKDPSISSLNKSKKGYFTVSAVHSDGVCKSMFVHRLVAEAFIPNPDNLPCVNHIDGNPHNNERYNLEWCTHKDNTRHYWDVIYEKSENKIYEYEITTPEGGIITIHNLRKWCRDNNLPYASFNQCLSGRSKTCCGGYTILRKH